MRSDAEPRRSTPKSDMKSPLRLARVRAVRALIVASIAAVGTASTLAGSNWPVGGDGAPSDGPGLVNHPVGVVPTGAVAIPEGWPLGPGGAITCTTCHAGIPTPGERRSANLRSRDGAGLEGAGAAFCAVCHTGPQSEARTGAHWQVYQLAHPRKADFKRLSGAGRVDVSSQRCLGCHDGVSAREVSYRVPGSGAGNHSAGYDDSSRNHPIGMAYPFGGKARGLSPLRPGSLLPREVVLPGGNVGCLSCHNLYSQHEMRLSVPVEGSQLCFTCHAMD